MFYGRAAGRDALFSLGLEHNEGDEWNLLRAEGRAGPFLGPRAHGGDAHCPYCTGAVLEGRQGRPLLADHRP